MHLNITGSGEHLVLIHGFCLTGTCFQRQVSLLSDRYTVVVPDLPGVGNSAYIENLSMERMADELRHALNDLGITSCVMTGQSMGGYVTLAFAKKYPGYLKGFGLLHSTANPDNDDRKSKRDQAIRVIQEHGYEYYVSRFIPPLFNEQFSDKELVQATIQDGLRTDSKAVIAHLLAMKNRPSSIDFLTETELPVHFIAGRYDTLISASDMIAQAALVKKGLLTTLKHSAHMGMLEEPQACADALAQFAEFCFNETLMGNSTRS